MPEPRKTVTVQGKTYPLKTDAERAASRPAPEPASRPAPLRDAEPMRESSTRNITISSAPRSVFLALTFSLVIFALAGGRVERVIAKVRGQPVPAANIPFTATTVFAWGALFVGLMLIADIPAISELGSAFAWLIFLAILIEFGPTALSNITNITTKGVPNAR